MRLLIVTFAFLILLFGFSRVKSSNLMVNNTIQKNETGLFGEADAERKNDIDNARGTGEIDTKKDINESINRDINSELLEEILSRQPEWRSHNITSQNSSVSVNQLINRIIADVLSIDGHEWEDSNNTGSIPSDSGIYSIIKKSMLKKEGAPEGSQLTIL